MDAKCYQAMRHAQRKIEIFDNPQKRRIATSIMTHREEVQLLHDKIRDLYLQIRASTTHNKSPGFHQNYITLAVPAEARTCFLRLFLNSTPTQPCTPSPSETLEFTKGGRLSRARYPMGAHHQTTDLPGRKDWDLLH